jgi:hypothetical protein
MKSSVFWNIMQCSPVKVNGLLAACYMLVSLFFDAEGEGDKFVRNVDLASLDYTALHSRRQHSSQRPLLEPLALQG